MEPFKISYETGIQAISNGIPAMVKKLKRRQQIKKIVVLSIIIISGTISLIAFTMA